jgi:hypothetical protein
MVQCALSSAKKLLGNLFFLASNHRNFRIFFKKIIVVVKKSNQLNKINIHQGDARVIKVWYYGIAHMLPSHLIANPLGRYFVPTYPCS